MERERERERAELSWPPVCSFGGRCGGGGGGVFINLAESGDRGHRHRTRTDTIAREGERERV